MNESLPIKQVQIHKEGLINIEHFIQLSYAQVLELRLQSDRGSGSEEYDSVFEFYTKTTQQ